MIVVEQLCKSYRLGTLNAQSFREELGGLLRLLSGRPAVARRERFHALSEISFSVEEGQVLGIIGHNGAGKSTLLKVISRITEPDSGRVRLRGRLASLLEVGTGFHPELTGRENVYLNGTILGMRKAEIDASLEEIVDFAGVAEFIDTPIKRYSTGMSVRLGFAVAAHLRPEILIVDEVLAVGDLEFQRRCLGKLESMSRSGRTVLFVSHNMASVQGISNQVLYLEHGRVKALGEPRAIINQYVEDSEATLMASTEGPLASAAHGVVVHGLAQVPLPGEPAGYCRHGGAVTFRIDLELTHRVKDLVLAIRLVGKDRENAAIVNSARRCHLPETPGRYEVMATIDRLDLQPGTYRLRLLAFVDRQPVIQSSALGELLIDHVPMDDAQPVTVDISAAICPPSRWFHRDHFFQKNP